MNKTKVLMTNGSLMKVESIAECSHWSILQYFWPALSDNWSWKPIFGLFESGPFRQVLLLFENLFRHWIQEYYGRCTSIRGSSRNGGMTEKKGPPFINS